jgi:hypothetical protein
MPTATFAQLCAHLENVSDSSATVFDLYQDVSNDTDPSGIKWFITHEDFMNNFYDRGVFKMRDCCNNIAVLHNWIVEPSGTDLSSAVYVGSDPSNCDLFSLIKEQWILDASNNCGWDISANWGTCSYMNMFRQLIPAGNLCNWDCKVCCALTAKELADVLNYEEYTNHNNVWPTGSVARTNVLPVKIGDCVTLSVRFTNANTCVNPIELRLHFIIDGWMDDWVGISNAIGGRQTIPPSGSGQWSASMDTRPFPFPPTYTVSPWPDFAGSFEPDHGRIWIDLSNCGGIVGNTPIGDSGTLSGGTLTIRGFSTNCPNDNFSDINAVYTILTHSVGITIPLAANCCEMKLHYMGRPSTVRWAQNQGPIADWAYTFSFQPP